MLKGIYSAAAGMVSQMTAMDVVADNLANVDTPGYKTSNLQMETFGDVLMKRVGNNAADPIGGFSQGSQVLSSVTNFAQGDLVQSGNTLDLALRGDGFFTVKLPGQSTPVYTRAGNFTRDSSGYLTTSDGSRVQGDKGDILIPRKAQKIEISRTGDVKADGVSVGKLKIAQFQDDQQLNRIGTNYYQTSETPLKQAKGVTVQQGFLERSNSNVVSELVSSMTGLRAYEMMQTGIQMQNETLSKSVNDVGRVS